MSDKVCYYMYMPRLTNEQMSIHQPHMRGKMPASTTRIMATYILMETKCASVNAKVNDCIRVHKYESGACGHVC